MKKRTTCIVLCVVLLLLGLTGCQNTADPNVKTGTYNGQTITMEYAVKTDIDYPHDMAYIRMVNGYALFYNYNYRDFENDWSGDPWNMLNRQGEIVFDVPYQNLSYFNSEGQAAGQNQSGEYVMVNASGEETPITEEEYRIFNKEQSDKHKEVGRHFEIEDYDETEDFESEFTVGYVYNGLAPYVQLLDDGTHLLGIIDENENIVIPAYLPVQFHWRNYRLSMYEDTIIIDDGGKIGIVTITRS